MTHRSEVSVEQLCELFTYDSATGELRWRSFASPRAGAGSLVSSIVKCGRKKDRKYYRFNYQGRQYMAHRVCFAIHHGHWPTGEIDHRNGDGLDNRIENLRDVSTTINHRNQILRNKPNASGVRGVIRKSGKWQAYIGRTSLGYFHCFGQALKARKQQESILGYINCDIGKRPPNE